MILECDIIIIGAGVIGCAIARELSKYKVKIAVLEKNNDLCEGVSKANSGVAHAGFNVPTNTLKAKTNVEGFLKIPKLAHKLNFPYKKTGKLVVAYNKEELEYLKNLKETGEKNACIGLEIIQEKDINKIEPYLKAKYALYSKKTGIINPYLFTIALAENSIRNGVRFYLNNEVNKIERLKNRGNPYKFIIKTNNNTFTSKWIINAAGLESDYISHMAGDKTHKIYPCRGEYLILDKDEKKILKTMIYPVPPKDGFGLGIHITPTIEGTVLIGPSAEYINNKSVENTQEVLNLLKNEAKKLLPEIAKLPVIRTYSGIRPKLISPLAKEKFRDFVIEESTTIPYLINLIGIESPGLTASPSIAEMVVDLIGQKQDLKVNKSFNPCNPPIKRFNELSISEKKQLVNENELYGEIICRCETITKYEVLQSINNILGIKTLDSIKRRCRTGMGRCQGAFCTPRVVKILINDFGMSETEIIKNSSDSNLFYGKIK